MSDYADNLRKSMINKTRRFMRMVQELKEKDDAALREQVIRMAREAGWSGLYMTYNEPTGRPDWEMVKERLTVPVTMDQIERFFLLAAAAGAKAEREACAKVCYELPWKDMGHIPSNLAFAAAIRARSKE